MKKILVDLDVLTVAFWDKNKEALDFLERIKKGQFELYTPYALLDTVGKWKNEKLSQKYLIFMISIRKKLFQLLKHYIEIYSLVTFNRKHLRNKRNEINEVLKKNGLKEVYILLPTEI